MLALAILNFGSGKFILYFFYFFFYFRFSLTLLTFALTFSLACCEVLIDFIHSLELVRTVHLLAPLAIFFLIKNPTLPICRHHEISLLRSQAGMHFLDSIRWWQWVKNMGHHQSTGLS